MEVTSLKGIDITVKYAIVGTVEFGVTVMCTLLLDYMVNVLEQLDYQLSALAFLRCELCGIEATQDEWDARNHFLTQYKDIAKELATLA